MFVLIVALMSTSLIGIITVQLYWINNALESKKEQFKNEVQKSLGSVSQRIKEKEELALEKEVDGLLENVGLASEAQIRNYF